MLHQLHNRQVFIARPLRRPPRQACTCVHDAIGFSDDLPFALSLLCKSALNKPSFSVKFP